MNAYFGNKPIYGLTGEKGPDGTPIGTIINFLGKEAPQNYLACDGSIYDISQYQELAELFANAFESSNYFGGDGVVTFAVPTIEDTSFLVCIKAK